MATVALRTALVQLAADEPGPALLALLDAWRACRHPRIADLVDLAAARLPPAPPLAGKTGSARDDAWRERARRKDPLDLDGLLAALWPAQWKQARPLLDLLDRFPDDPRLARGLARLFVSRPYDSTASERLYELATATLVRLRDVRSVAILEGVGAATAAAAVAARARVPPLDAATEAAIRDVEAAFAADRAAAAVDAAREAQLLDAIYAEPDDDGARAVYGDLLALRGDPRGELIALQLAGGSNGARIAALLDEHGTAWARPLGDHFERASFVFDRGFFAGGTLQTRTTIPGDRAWRLVRTLECSVEDPAALPWAELRSLRSLSCPGALAAHVATSGPATITQLEARSIARDHDALARCDGLPALRALSLSGEPPGWLADAPVLDRVARLALHGFPGFLDLVTLVTRRPSSLVELLLSTSSWWQATLRRPDPASPFADAVIEPRVDDGSALWFTDALIALVEHVAAAADLRRLSISTGKHRRKLRDAPRLEPVLARLAERGIEVVRGWPAEEARVVLVELHGQGLLGPGTLPAAWRMLGELDQRYDGFTIGSGEQVRPLGDDPLAALGAVLKRPKTRQLTLQRGDGARDRAMLALRDGGERVLYPCTELALVLRSTELDALASWFVRLADVGDVDGGGCDVPASALRGLAGSQRIPWRIAGVHLKAHWLTVVPAQLLAKVPRADLAAIVATLDGVTLLHGERVTVLRLAADPADVTRERSAAIEAAFVTRLGN